MANSDTREEIFSRISKLEEKVEDIEKAVKKKGIHPENERKVK